MSAFVPSVYVFIVLFLVNVQDVTTMADGTGGEGGRAPHIFIDSSLFWHVQDVTTMADGTGGEGGSGL